VACNTDPFTCRRDHIASHLEDAEADDGDFEARCPCCGHGGFRVSKPTRSRSYRHIWTCACPWCRCRPGAIRVALLKLGIRAACLGIYDGDVTRAIQPEAARRLDLAARDILATSGLRPADIRIIIAEALGRKVPEDYRAFVRFAIEAGVGRRQAYEAAARWCRPSDLSPPTNRGVGR